MTEPTRREMFMGCAVAPFSGVERDPEYDWIPPIAEPSGKRGAQCGECGIKFDYGQHYGFYCSSTRCPRR